MIPTISEETIQYVLDNPGEAIGPNRWNLDLANVRSASAVALVALMTKIGRAPTDVDLRVWLAAMAFGMALVTEEQRMVDDLMGVGDDG